MTTTIPYADEETSEEFLAREIDEVLKDIARGLDTTPWTRQAV